MPRIGTLNDFVKWLYKKDDSVFTCVEGPKGSGKTEFNLLLLERAHDLGLFEGFGSNMPIPEALTPSFEMDFIQDFETLEQRCRLLNPNPEKHGLKKYLFFLSEIGKFVPRDQAWKKENIQFIEKLQTVRKYGLSMQTDAIDRVDARILSPRFFHGRFEKPFSLNPKFATYTDFRTNRTFTFKDIPRCTMWFNTYYTADFYLTKQDGSSNLALDQSEEIVKRYMETGSWKESGVTTQQGKREMFKILKRYFAIREPSNHEPVKKEPELEVVSTE